MKKASISNEKKNEIFIQHCLKSNALPKHVEMINFSLKTFQVKADFFVTIIVRCDRFKGNATIYTELFNYIEKHFETVNSYRFEISSLYSPYL